MKRRILTSKELITLFDRGGEEPPTLLLGLIAAHLESRKSLECAAMLARAVQESGWKEPPIPVPGEALPPMV